MAGVYTPGLPIVSGSNTALPALQGTELVPVDTGLANGEGPQTVAATSFQVAAMACAAALNAASATAGAATLAGMAGSVTSEALSTAAGATYTLTITNTAMTAATAVQAVAYSKSNTTPGFYVSSITPASGSLVIVVTNGGTAALNGTIIVSFWGNPN